MCSELTPRARIPDTRIPQLMQPWPPPSSSLSSPGTILSGNQPYRRCLRSSSSWNSRKATWLERLFARLLVTIITFVIVILIIITIIIDTLIIFAFIIVIFVIGEALCAFIGLLTIITNLQRHHRPWALIVMHIGSSAKKGIKSCGNSLNSKFHAQQDFQ